jgi:hypothetical protein
VPREHHRIDQPRREPHPPGHAGEQVAPLPLHAEQVGVAAVPELFRHLDDAARAGDLGDQHHVGQQDGAQHSRGAQGGGAEESVHHVAEAHAVARDRERPLGARQATGRKPRPGHRQPLPSVRDPGRQRIREDGVGCLPERGHECLQPAGRMRVVIRSPGEQVRARGVGERGHGIAHVAEAVRVTDERHPGVARRVLRRDLRGPVGGRIVDDGQGELAPGLGQEGLDGLANVSLSVVGDHAERHLDARFAIGHLCHATSGDGAGRCRTMRLRLCSPNCKRPLKLHDAQRCRKQPGPVFSGGFAGS